MHAWHAAGESSAGENSRQPQASSTDQTLHMTPVWSQDGSPRALRPFGHPTSNKRLNKHTRQSCIPGMQAAGEDWRQLQARFSGLRISPWRWEWLTLDSQTFTLATESAPVRDTELHSWHAGSASAGEDWRQLQASSTDQNLHMSPFFSGQQFPTPQILRTSDQQVHKAELHAWHAGGESSAGEDWRQLQASFSGRVPWWEDDHFGVPFWDQAAALSPSAAGPAGQAPEQDLKPSSSFQQVLFWSQDQASGLRPVWGPGICSAGLGAAGKCPAHAPGSAASPAPEEVNSVQDCEL